MKNACLAVLVTLIATGCGGSESEAMPEEETMPEVTPAPPPAASVSITFPGDGSEIDGPNLTVELSTTVRIVPAGEMLPGTGHHHLYLDADLTEVDVPVPTVPGSIIHMGDGSSEYLFEGVSPGEHRLIAVVADGAHVPLQPLVVDTVMFTVR